MAIRKLALGALLLIAGLGPAGAESEEGKKAADAHRAEIEAFYPQMINALNAGEFDTARNLVRQAISWEAENPLHYYNLACIEARAGNGPIALAALQNAVDLGFNNLDLIDKDTDLDSIRKEETFRKMYQVIAINNLAAKEGGGPEVAEVYNMKDAKPDPTKATATEVKP